MLGTRNLGGDTRHVVQTESHARMRKAAADAKATFLVEELATLVQ